MSLSKINRDCSHVEVVTRLAERNDVPLDRFSSEIPTRIKTWKSGGTSEFAETLVPKTNQLKRTSENAQVAMALLANTFRAVVGLPWSTFELLDRAMRWSAMSVAMEEPTSEMWAEDLFPPCSSKWLANYDEEATDSSGSEIYDDEVEEEDDSDWSCSEDEEELEGFSFDYGGDVDFWGDRWFWSLDGDELEADAETSSYVVERFVDYIMPSMDFNTEEVDVWIEKYGSSRSQVRFVTLPLSVDSPTAFDLPTACTSIGLFVAVL